MTNLKTALISTILVTAASAPAFAGPDSETPFTTSNEITATSTISAADENLVGEILQTDGQPDAPADFELLTHDGDMISEFMARALDSDHNIRNNAIVVPSSSGELTTVNCPIGTTAQVDMTCLVTGNFSLERTARLFEQEAEEEREAVLSSEAISNDAVVVYPGTLTPTTVVEANL